MPLPQARTLAGNAKAMLVQGKNPIFERLARQSEANAMPTFAAFADELLPEICKGFRNDKHKAQWSSTLKAMLGC